MLIDVEAEQINLHNNLLKGDKYAQDRRKSQGGIVIQATI